VDRNGLINLDINLNNSIFMHGSKYEWRSFTNEGGIVSLPGSIEKFYKKASISYLPAALATLII